MTNTTATTLYLGTKTLDFIVLVTLMHVFIICNGNIYNNNNDDI